MWGVAGACVELLGDLLFKVGGHGPPPPPDERRPHPPTLSTHAHHTHPAQVAGATGRIQQDLTNEEEEGLSTESHGQALIDALGMDK